LVKKDIANFKEDQICRELLEYLLSISEEILKKLETFQKSIKLHSNCIKKYEEIVLFCKKNDNNNRSLRSAKKNVQEMCDQFLIEILDCIRNNDYDESFIENINESFFIVSVRLKIKTIFSKLLSKIASLACDFKQEIQNEIKKIISNHDEIKWNTVEESKKIYRLVKQHIKEALTISHNQLKQNYEEVNDGVTKQLKFCLNQIYLKSADFLEENFYVEIDPAQANKLKVEIDSKISALVELKTNIQNSIKIKALDCSKDAQSSTEEEFYPKPLLFQTGNSNKLPTDIKQIEISEINNYFKRFNYESVSNVNYNGSQANVNKTKKKIIPDCFKNLLNEGKEKSQLKIMHIPCEQTDFVQFKIDRENKNISAEYNQKFIQEKVDNLRKKIDNFEKDKNSRTLHPIFISSRLRKNETKQSETKQSFIEMNIVARDLLDCGLNKECFLIFLFIQAGTETTRDEFKKEIEYYENLKNNNCPCQNKLECPIVLCYLPEVFIFNFKNIFYKSFSKGIFICINI